MIRDSEVIVCLERSHPNLHLITVDPPSVQITSLPTKVQQQSEPMRM